MPNPVTDYEALIDAAVAGPSRDSTQAVKAAFDPFVSALLRHITAHFVKHLEAAEAEEMLKSLADRNQAALDWSAQLRAAFASAEADGRTPTLALAELVSPEEPR
jgi:hypothetical protein